MTKVNTNEKVPNPTSDQLRQALSYLEKDGKSTMEDEYDRKFKDLRGLAQPEPMPEGSPTERVEIEHIARPVDQDPELAEYFNTWWAENMGRQPKHIYSDIVEDTSGLEIPTLFIDDLIDQAKTKVAEKKSEAAKVLDNIKSLKIVFLDKPEKIFNIMIKGTDTTAAGESESAVVVLSFEAKPPFALKRIKSSHGNFSF